MPTILDTLSIQTCVVSYGKEASFAGSLANVAIQVTAKALGVPQLRLVWAATGDIFSSFTDSTVGGNGTPGIIVLPQTGQDGFRHGTTTFKDWYYEAAVTATTNDGQQLSRTYRFQIPAGTTTLDLDMLDEDGIVTAMPAIAPILAEPAGLSPDTLAVLDGRYQSDVVRDVPEWQPSTAYTANEIVLNPSGQLVQAVATFTSGATYNAANWTVVSLTVAGVQALIGAQAATDASTYVPQTQLGVVSGVATLGSDGVLTPGQLPLSTQAITLSGQGAPSAALGLNGDWYLDATGGGISTKIGGAWSLIGTITGQPTTTQVFTGNGTYTVPAGAKTIRAICLGAGGGGGSGARYPAASIPTGGAGGGGAGRAEAEFQATDLTATVTVVVGAAGSAGAAVTTDATNGNPGGSGGASSFGGYIKTTTAAGGAGGSAGAAAVGGSGGGGQFVGGTGLSSSATGGAGTGFGSSTGGGPGGSSGGGISSTGTPAAGGAGGQATWTNGSNATAGAVGSSGSAGAANAAGLPGGSGAGGGSSVSVAGGNGGNGARGAGGGGGAASINGFNSGAGGTGGSGIVLVVAYF